MNHEQFREWLQLSLYDELRSEEQKSLEVHLSSCEECRAELEELKQMHATFQRAPRIPVTELLLQQARQELRGALRIERSRVSFWDMMVERIDEVLAPWAKVAVGAAAMLTVGLFAGYLLFSSDAGSGGMIVQQVSDATEVIRGDAQITNVKFDDPDPSDGQIVFSFDAVTPVQVRGNPNDPGVQSVLTKALLYEENPGVRLRAVSAITSQIQIQTSKPTGVDKEVKSALIEAMQHDDNPGVRKEALQALRKFPFDSDIKQGLLYVLGNDKNEGLRVEAINALAAAKDEFISSDQQLLEILRKRVESDNNRYVRQRARAVLEEVK